MRPERLPYTGPGGHPLGKREVIAALRERLARFEGGALAPGRLRTLRLGLAAVDRALPWGGLPRGCLHEVAAAGGGPAEGAAATTAAAAGFCAVLLGLFARTGPVLWVSPRDDLFAPGLVELGLRPSRLLVVRARRRAEVLWAFEEALRTPALAAALAEVDHAAGTAAVIGLNQGRRLQLAAEGSGVTGLLLRHRRSDGWDDAAPSAAVTRWRVGAAPSRAPRGSARRLGPGAPRWRVELVRCRGGGGPAGGGCWTVEWRRGDWRHVDDHDGDHGDAAPTGAVAVAAEPGDRPARPPRAGGLR